MIHLGDITQIRGDKIPVVDIITGGSPCQDLSIAGKRAGLDGERSGLFMEQIRIVKEMRERDRRNGRSAWLVRPRFMVWENVPGAFSSNKGRDFQAVLSEIVKIAEPDAPDVSLPEGGRWNKAGCLYSDVGNWSIAWRVHDAQFWGVPQRRKRIALVADFGGLAAPEILFERKGLSRDIEPGGAERQGAAGAVETSVASTITATYGTKWNGNAGAYSGGNFVIEGSTDGAGGSLTSWDFQSKRIFDPGGVCATLNSGNTEGGNITPSVFCLQGNGIDRADTAGCNGRGWREGQSYTLNTIDRPAVYDARGNGDGEIVSTLTGDHNNRVTDYTALCVGNGQLNQMSMSEQANTLDTMHDQQAVMIAASLSAIDYKGPCAQDLGNNMANYPIQNSFVRRLTPLECERLQGYPDGWTDIGEWTDAKGKKHKEADSPRYKALGNSIALPFWQWMARRICAQYERTPAMGSLFDGIGGFPLVFQRSGAVPVWASEIEEFPIAVTKRHFPEDTGDS